MKSNDLERKTKLLWVFFAGFFGIIVLFSLRGAAFGADKFGATPVSQYAPRKIVDNGDSLNRIDLLVLGEGFTAAETKKYHQKVQEIFGISGENFFSYTPFKEYQKYFNVWLVDTPSNESGVSKPENPKDTFFKLRAEKGFVVDYQKIYSFIESLNLPDWPETLIMVNDEEYRGTGGAFAIFSLHSSAYLLAVHEFGHSFGGLTDEYDEGWPWTKEQINDMWPEGDIPNVNISKYFTANELSANRKWSYWLDKPEVGIFPTGQYGAVSRSQKCTMMRSINCPSFGWVNSEELRLKMAEKVHLIEKSFPAKTRLFLEENTEQKFEIILAPEPTDHKYQIKWYIDGMLVSENTSEFYASFQEQEREHKVKVEVSDNTEMVRRDLAGVMRDEKEWIINDIPVADAGPDQTILVGTTVIIDGSGKQDENGNNNSKLSYRWAMTLKPDGSEAEFSSYGFSGIVFTPDKDGFYQFRLIVSNGIESEPDYVTVRAIGDKQKFVVNANQSVYSAGDTLELYVWIGNAGPDVKIDAFVGFGLPDGSIWFLDKNLELQPSDTENPTSFTPFAKNVNLPNGYAFPLDGEANADTDGNGKLDGYRLFSKTLPPLPQGEYFAFAALAESGSIQAGSPKIIGEIALKFFEFE